MRNKQSNNSRIWLGVILIVVGLLIFMRNFHFNILFVDIFSWPFILLIVGIVVLVNSRDSFLGLLLVVLGGVGLAARYLNTSYGEIFSEYWPILLIFLGIYTLFKNVKISNSKKSEIIETNDSLIDIFSFISDQTKIIKSSNFKGGKITTILSELAIDFRDSKLEQGVFEMDFLTILGSTKLFIPNDWNIIIRTTTIFGGFDDKRSESIQQDSTDKNILIIKGLVLFGGGSITS